MKVVHLITTSQGGAYKAARRINEALKSDGEMESVIISMSDYEMGIADKIIYKIRHKIYSHFPVNPNQLDHYFNTDIESIPIHKLPQVRQADIIHLHWVTAGMIGMKTLKKIVKMGKPIVWTLHDMHPFTGGCHYDDECGKYVNQCGECKQLKSTKRSDISSWNQKQKETIIKSANLIAVGCSKWITECAKNSFVMRNMRCITIPNCIETQLYKPCNRSFAREMLNIEFGDRKIIAFGAMSSTSDKRKGYVYLLKALENLDPTKYGCVIFGGEGESVGNMPVKSMGCLRDDFSLALLYAAADVFVAPSLQENLANTVMEALSCGTPVVAFDVGGMRDLITHEYNGYLAQKYDTEDLKMGICLCCEHAEWGDNGRKTVLDKFTLARIASEYIEIYKSLV